MVVVRTHDAGNHVVGKRGDDLRMGHVHAAVALDDDGLAFLRTQNGAQAGACGMIARIDEAGVRQQVFAGRPDGGHAEAVAFATAQRLGGGTGPHAPYVGSVFDADLVVEDPDVHGLVGSAFDDEGVPAGQLELRADHAAAVGIHDQVVGGERRQMRERGAARQGRARCGKRAHGHDHFAFRAERIGACRHFVIHDLIRKTHAAQEILVWVGGLGGDLPRGQVHAGYLALPAIGDVFGFHVFLQVFAVTLKRACEDMCAIDPLMRSILVCPMARHACTLL